MDCDSRIGTIAKMKKTATTTNHMSIANNKTNKRDNAEKGCFYSKEVLCPEQSLRKDELIEKHSSPQNEVVTTTSSSSSQQPLKNNHPTLVSELNQVSRIQSWDQSTTHSNSSSTNEYTARKNSLYHNRKSSLPRTQPQCSTHDASSKQKEDILLIPKLRTRNTSDHMKQPIIATFPGTSPTRAKDSIRNMSSVSSTSLDIDHMPLNPQDLVETRKPGQSTLAMSRTMSNWIPNDEHIHSHMQNTENFQNQNKDSSFLVDGGCSEWNENSPDQHFIEPKSAQETTFTYPYQSKINNNNISSQTEYGIFVENIETQQRAPISPISPVSARKLKVERSTQLKSKNAELLQKDVSVSIVNPYDVSNRSRISYENVKSENVNKHKPLLLKQLFDFVKLKAQQTGILTASPESKHRLYEQYVVEPEPTISRNCNSSSMDSYSLQYRSSPKGSSRQSIPHSPSNFYAYSTMMRNRVSSPINLTWIVVVVTLIVLISVLVDELHVDELPHHNEVEQSTNIVEKSNHFDQIVAFAGSLVAFLAILAWGVSAYMSLGSLRSKYRS